MIDLEQQLTDHLRSRAAAVNPRYDLEAVEHDGPAPVEFVPRHERPRRRPLTGVLVGAAAAAALVVAAVVVTGDDASRIETGSTADASPTTAAAQPPASLFLGGWTSTDTDGSVQTMEIESAAAESVELTIHDAAATAACAGASSTMTGIGQLDSGGDIVIASPVLTCDDGSEPPSEAQLRDFTLAHDPQAGTLTDTFGVVWWREGTDAPSPAPPPTSGTMWPQSSLDEVREAQELADAGAPAYTWQLDPQLSSEEWWAYLRQPGAEIVERFLREELGWDKFLFNPYQGDDGDGAADGVIRGVVYLRCGPGETNPLYPTAPDGHQEAPGAERCAPTIDELRYETVSLDLSQLDRRGAGGIWVVSGSRTTAPFAQRDPLVAEAEATARLEDFLRARIEGEGAEGYVEVGGETFATIEEVPLLYATTTGAPYERSELERVSGPSWPYGAMEFKVRLFADGGETVVEQLISSDEGGPLGLWSRITDTTENGQPVPVPYGFFDGEVTASAPDPWKVSPFFPVALTLDSQLGHERVELVGDPFPVATGCERGPAPADANALAQSLQSDPDLQVNAPVEASVGGVAGLAMDVTVVPGASICEAIPSPQVVTQDDGHTGPGPPGLNLDQGSRMRLYLVDLPEGSSTRILAIAVVAPEARFEDVLEAAAPIIDSIDFHPGGS